jgi:addiction module HigA family antidote
VIAAAPVPIPAGVPRRAPVHPGRFLERHYLEPLSLTQTETARRLGVSRRRVNELVQGRRAMTPDTAIRCAQVFGLPAADWLALQSEWDSYAAWKQLRQAQRAVR